MNIMFNSTYSTIDDIVLDVVKIYRTNKTQDEYISKKPYSEALKQLVENVINKNNIAYKDFIDTYNAVIPNYNIKLNIKEANKLFKKYILPATYEATIGNRSTAIVFYRSLIDKLNDICIGRNRAIVINKEKIRAKQLLIKKEVA